MKRAVLGIATIFVLGLAGCNASVTPLAPAPGDFDPVYQVAFGGVKYEQGPKYDVGIGIYRTQRLDGSLDYGSARMAFQVNGNAEQVSVASINRMNLNWCENDSEIQYPNFIYASSNIGTDSNLDSIAFTYEGFDGTSFSSFADLAPTFGTITLPVAISASQGCSIRYENSIPGDSLVVIAGAGDSGLLLVVPDTGRIVFPPYQLPFDSTTALYGYSINWYRVRWTTMTTPSGKRIGIYSSQQTSLPQCPAAR